MWYAILDIHNEVVGMTWLLYGSLQEIADSVIEQCHNCDPTGNCVLDFDAIEEEGFYCEADAFHELNDAETITPDLLKDFYFTLSGADVSVHCLAEGYDAFRQAFAEYDGRNSYLEELRLSDTLPPEEEQAFAEELADILFDEKYYSADMYVDEWKYVSVVMDEDEEDEAEDI